MGYDSLNKKCHALFYSAQKGFQRSLAQCVDTEEAEQVLIGWKAFNENWKNMQEALNRI